uniref:CASP-like protein n=1 Tax=Triticum urartu TaxID=4572 RepID=A0A8R7TCT7_TRIUA
MLHLLGIFAWSPWWRSCTLRRRRNFRRMRRGAGHASFLDIAGDQMNAYLLVTASAVALPITVRMSSAVVNIFTGAIMSSICLGFMAFAALALSPMLSGCKLSRQAHYESTT